MPLDNYGSSLVINLLIGIYYDYVFKLNYLLIWEYSNGRCKYRRF